MRPRNRAELLRPDLAAVIAQQISSLTGNDLAAWRSAVLPIFDAWTEASPLTTPLDDSWWSNLTAPNGTTTASLGSRPDLHFVVEDGPTGQTVVDVVYAVWMQIESTWQVVWKFASGRTVRDENDDPVAAPTLQQALATELDAGESWASILANELAFLERYVGEPLPLGSVLASTSTMIAEITGIVDFLYTQLNVQTIRLAVQGPLKDTIFAGITYDPVADNFHAATDRGLVPVFEEIFDLIPTEGATDFVSAWSEIMDFIISDFDRGEDYLEITPSWIFANIVAAYETTEPPVSIVDLAGAFGIDESVIRTALQAPATLISSIFPRAIRPSMVGSAKTHMSSERASVTMSSLTTKHPCMAPMTRCALRRRLPPKLPRRGMAMIWFFRLMGRVTSSALWGNSPAFS